MERAEELVNKAGSIIEKTGRILVRPEYQSVDHIVPHLFGSLLTYLYVDEMRDQIFNMDKMGRSESRLIMEMVVDRIRQEGRQLGQEELFMEYLRHYWRERKHKPKTDRIFGKNWHPLLDYENEVSVLGRDFYDKDGVKVAENLIGKRLFRYHKRKINMGIITETESYLGSGDPAAHVAKGRTKRTEVIYGEAGHAYIYVIHGHHALNVVCSRQDSVLIRSVDWVEGPGRLTRAMGITKDLYGADLTDPSNGLYITDNPNPPGEIVVTPRVGVKSATDWPLRFITK